MKPSEHYQQDVAAGLIKSDANQAAVLPLLDNLAAKLQKRSFFKKMQQGLYLWGPVGRGKTYLMDLFYNALPFKKKLRLHFHRFMQTIHQQLRLYQGKADPLQRIAKAWAKDVKVLCLDEFFVEDIADAMLLTGLLQALHKQGICILMTSNQLPDDLYQGGLQRAQFLPAIDWIKSELAIIELDSGQDYRQELAKTLGSYFVGHDHKPLQQWFDRLSLGHAVTSRPLALFGREIPVVKRAFEVIWFDFNVICQVPRSHHDYLAIAEEYRTVIVANVPQFNQDNETQLHFFIQLVDVFYDEKVSLIVSAVCPIDDLYLGEGKLKKAFKRTQSRLKAF